MLFHYCRMLQSAKGDNDSTAEHLKQEPTERSSQNLTMNLQS